MLTHIKSWLLPALFFSGFAFASTEKRVDIDLNSTKIVELSSHARWHALLHLRDAKPMITDKRFILSGANFSPLLELQATVGLLNENYLDTLCRFPARASWIFQQLERPLSSSAFEHCKELYDYLNHVPFNEVDLVFASEVLSSASSMMGHVFLKAKGENYRQNEVEHAISFFTEFDTFNPLRLIYDGLIGGMSGFFIVRPYSIELNRYLNIENRNLFEYRLALTNTQSKLLQLHIWELKDVEIEYLFQSYNCATLTLYILAVAEPHIKASESMIVTPADVVKAADKHELVDEININLANEWAITSLELQLGPDKTDYLQGILQHIKPSLNDSLLSLPPLEMDYLQRLVAVGNFSDSLDEATQRKIETSSLLENSQMTIVPSAAKDPVSSPQDSIFSAQVQRSSNDNRLRLSWLPASHYIRTVNSQFLSESELKIGELSVSIAGENANLRLEQFTLYSFKSLAPTTVSQPRNSGSLFIGYRQQRDSNLDSHGFVSLQGGIGKSYRLHRDVVAFGLVELELGASLDKELLSASVSSGLIFNLAWDTKLRTEFSLIESSLSDATLQYGAIELSNQTTKNTNVYFSAENWVHQSKSDFVATLGFDWHF